jgi:hypothetical protein
VLFRVAADGLVLAGHDLAELQDLLGWRLVAVDGVPLERFMTSYTPVPVENAYGSYRGAASLVRSLRSMAQVLPGIRAEAPMSWTLRGPGGVEETRTVSWGSRSSTPAAEWRTSPKGLAGRLLPEQWYAHRLVADGRAGYLRLGSLMGREAFEMAFHANAESAEQQAGQVFRFLGLDPPVGRGATLAAVPSLFSATLALLTEMKHRGATTLIVDLRGNEGGWTASAYPMMHAIYGDTFHARPRPGEYVRVESALYLQKSNRTPDEMRAADPTFRAGRYVFSTGEDASGEEVRRARVAEYLAADYTFARALEALGGEPVYRPRRVVALCDERTFSAGFHILVWLRAMGADVVGVPPRQSPNAFMEVTPFSLPESGLRGSISNAVQHMLAQDRTTDVFQPGFPVTAEIFRRFAEADDPILSYALELLGRGSSR